VALVLSRKCVKLPKHNSPEFADSNSRPILSHPRHSMLAGTLRVECGLQPDLQFRDEIGFWEMWPGTRRPVPMVANELQTAS
jgi:hypothetical protein